MFSINQKQKQEETVDTGNGRFATLSDRVYRELNLKKANGLFKVGEVVEIHNSSFLLDEITEDGKLSLHLLSDLERTKNIFNEQALVSAIETEEERKNSMHQARNIFNKGKIHG